VTALQVAGSILDDASDGPALLAGLAFYMHSAITGTDYLVAGTSGGTTDYFKWEF
jgi:hypothetical protein